MVTTRAAALTEESTVHDGAAGNPLRTLESPAGGRLVINADDWGRDAETTDKTFACVERGTVSAASAMVFMEDSERAARIALEHDLDTGLHLNFSASFTASNCPATLVEHHRKVARFLLSHALARVVFHPGLVRSFAYVVQSQMDEYQRLYGEAPERLDGHHHLHLSANVLRGNLLPAGTLVRRNFSFQPGEKSALNRWYRRTVDRRVSRRHRVMDYLFTLPPLEPVARLERIFQLAQQSQVELETHPVHLEEYRYLSEGGIFRQWPQLRIARGFRESDPSNLPSSNQHSA